MGKGHIMNSFLSNTLSIAGVPLERQFLSSFVLRGIFMWQIDYTFEIIICWVINSLELFIMAEHISKLKHCQLVLKVFLQVPTLSASAAVPRCLRLLPISLWAVGGPELTAPVTPSAIDSVFFWPQQRLLPFPVHPPPLPPFGARVETEGPQHRHRSGPGPRESETFLSNILTGHPGFSSPPSKASHVLMRLFLLRGGGPGYTFLQNMSCCSAWCIFHCMQMVILSPYFPPPSTCFRIHHSAVCASKPFPSKCLPPYEALYFPSFPLWNG